MGTQGADNAAAGWCKREVGEVANMAARATAAKPLRPTPAIPAAPPDLVSNSGDTKEEWFDGAGEGVARAGW